MRSRPSHRNSAFAKARLMVSLIVGTSLTLVSVSNASAREYQASDNQPNPKSTWLSDFAPSVSAATIPKSSAMKEAGDAPAPYNATLLVVTGK